MSETWVNIYLWALIGLSVVGIFLLVLRPLSRLAANPKSSDERVSALRRKSFIRECVHLAVGVMALALFKLGVLGGWAVVVIVSALLIGFEFVLPLMARAGGRAAG
jgi:hypothetical protein